MKKIVIKTVDGKTIRMTEEEYDKKYPPIELENNSTLRAYTYHGYYPNRFAGKRAHET
jgi:hypothetical protein